MTKYTRDDVRTALRAYGERYTPADAQDVLATTGYRFMSLPEDMFSAVIAATKMPPGAELRGANDGEPLDPYQQAGKANNDAAREYWDDRKAAQAAGEPVPDLPADPHNTRQLEKLGKDRDAMKKASGNFWNED